MQSNSHLPSMKHMRTKLVTIILGQMDLNVFWFCELLVHTKSYQLIYRAASAWTGNVLVGLLKDNSGIMEINTTLPQVT